VVGGGADADKSAAADIKKFQLLADLAAGGAAAPRFSRQRKKIALLGKSRSAASLMHPRFTFSCLSAKCNALLGRARLSNCPRYALREQTYIHTK
jgi:hypothetical protein